MKTIKGTIKKSDVEGGVWVLEEEGGGTYQLRGGPQDIYRENRKVTVKGEIDEDLVGFGMSGPILKVREIKG